MPVRSNAYNSLWQVRTNAWTTLEESTAQLALAGAQQQLTLPGPVGALGAASPS